MGKKKSGNGHLTAEELAHFKSLLVSKQREILGNVRSMEAETLQKERSELSNMPLHMADAGSDNYEIDNTLGLMSGERNILKEIKEALDRMEKGAYGICEGNGKAIPKARLEAIPWTKYSVEYASQMEKGRFNLNGSSSYKNFDYGDEEDSSDGEYVKIER